MASTSGSDIVDVPLSKEAERLYLSYALSVVTARALPDVRDGLKPVQRRILYGMQKDLALGPDSKPKKCARIVGDVMGKYHPHGDSAIYDALVRMAQDWVLRSPLVYGHGNFGSLDGDSAAAHRYTEAKLQKIAMELLSELPKKTVAFRPNYDGTQFEPVVLPARFPNLLVNGSQGIAVGMATSIPPHNLGEVIEACQALISDRKISVRMLLKKVRGPDFPTGGELVNSHEEIASVYESGQGSLKLRGEWKVESDKQGERVVITSIPHGLEKKAIVEKIADVIISKKLPELVDVRDESTNDVRIVLEMKKDGHPEKVMAYLYKNTPLLTNVSVNLTCLVPSKNPEVATPARLDLKQILEHFIDFRFEMVTKRLEFELAELNRRLHLLAGFEKVFDALDEIIRIIRKSEGKQDAAEKIMKRFGLDEDQTDAILELKLYRLAKLEILLIQKEAAEKRQEKARIEGLLKSPAKRWKMVSDELEEIKTQYGDKRRTKIVKSTDDEPEFAEEDFIVEQDGYLILTTQGWVKRQGSVKDLASTRVREGDEILACEAGSTRASVAFFSSQGVCYVSRFADIPLSTGYGDPVQKLFKMADGERIVGAMSFDPRILEVKEAKEGAEPEPPFAVAVTRKGQVLQFSLRPHREPSTRAGRKFARPRADDEVMNVFLSDGKKFVIAASDDGHAIAVKLADIPVLSGAGKGVMLMKLGPKASLIGAAVLESARAGKLVALSEGGRRYELTVEGVEGTRGGRGKAVVKKSRFAGVERGLPEVASLGESE